jgi:hypothetical protein
MGRAVKGGRPSWATAEQEQFLLQKLQVYVSIQREGAKGLAEFWPPLWEDWFERWPEPNLTPEMISEGETVQKQFKAKKNVSTIVLVCRYRYLPENVKKARKAVVQ